MLGRSFKGRTEMCGFFNFLDLNVLIDKITKHHYNIISNIRYYFI